MQYLNVTAAHCIRQEVIDLTVELIGNKQTETESEDEEKDDDKAEGTDVPQHNWQSGDQCLAQWSEDGQYYEAKVDEILEDGTCTVSLLKKFDPNNKRAGNSDDGPEKKKSKKDLIAQQREYKRKKHFQKQIKARSRKVFLPHQNMLMEKLVLVPVESVDDL
ncbi:hypothetical protein KUTeg_000144 [Tegillarca granosa]|uniref:Tudor domain-containing protein n=1 Tax=Tegillarca granosa TaxID=220873 RepID=A0ABQ9G131_TEGGR|nr:hypothetical protein KUTeg_000144 [Tegillarca granosa]